MRADDGAGLGRDGRLIDLGGTGSTVVRLRAAPVASPETTLTFRDAANAVVAVNNPYRGDDGSIAPVTGI